jgi:hypothetical protein
MSANGKRARLAALVGIMAAVAMIGGWWITTRPTTPISQERAGAIARDFATSADAHGAGSTVSGVSVYVEGLHRTDGHDAWKVHVSRTLTEAGGTTYPSVMWLSIDAATGAVAVIAQG